MDENLQNANYHPSDLDFGCRGTLYGWNPKPAAFLVNMHSRNPRVVKRFRSFVRDTRATRAGGSTPHGQPHQHSKPCFYVSQREYVVAFYSTSFVALSEGLTLHATIATKQCLLHDKCDAEIVGTIVFSKLGLCQNYSFQETIVFSKPGVLLKL